MTAMFFERSAAGHRWWQAAADMIGRFAVRMRRARKARRDRRHLRRLPDYLLRDIGVSRLEVEAMTRLDDSRRDDSRRDDSRRFVVVPGIGWRQAP